LFMTGVVRVKYLFLLGCSLVVSVPVMAQETSGEEVYSVASLVPEVQITVTASGTRERIDQTGQSISVIGAEEIAAVQGADITRVLERLPGVSWTRNGPLGSATSVFVRGAGSEQLLVLVDGVRMADQAAPSGGFDFGTLLPSGLGKIELLRGSNSVVWGSDAIGGVLAVTTRRESGVRASLEYGANDSFDASADAGIAGEGYFLGIDGGWSRSDGISAFAPGGEDDGFRQWRIGGSGRAALGAVTLVAAARHADSRIEFDGYPPPNYDTFADTLEYQTTRQTSGRTGFEYAGGSLDLRGGVSLSRTRRAYFDAAFGNASSFETDGRSVRADLSGHAELTGGLSLDFGADSEWTRFSTTFDPRQSARLASGHALLGWKNDSVSLAAGVRLDDHDRFGSAWTFGANGAVQLGGGWRLRASYGEGFKAPTLYQLYGFGGNVLLEPEQSRSYDAGIEYGDRNGALHFAATLFRRDSRNQIDYVFPAGYFNVRRTRAEGFELEGAAAVSERLHLRAVYTWLKAVNRATGTDLARRPRHALTASLDWRSPLADLTLGADLRLVGDTFDDAGNFTQLDGHGLATLRASLPLGTHLEAFGRIENLFDQQYQVAAGYGTYGRSAYGGVRVKW
jgi:vitamin B12 transporter